MEKSEKKAERIFQRKNKFYDSFNRLLKLEEIAKIEILKSHLVRFTDSQDTPQIVYDKLPNGANAYYFNSFRYNVKQSNIPGEDYKEGKHFVDVFYYNILSRR